MSCSQYSFLSHLLVCFLLCRSISDALCKALKPVPSCAQPTTGRPMPSGILKPQQSQYIWHSSEWIKSEQICSLWLHVLHPRRCPCIISPQLQLSCQNDQLSPSHFCWKLNKEGCAANNSSMQFKHWRAWPWKTSFNKQAWHKTNLYQQLHVQIHVQPVFMLTHSSSSHHRHLRHLISSFSSTNFHDSNVIRSHLNKHSTFCSTNMTALNPIN